MEHKVCPGTPGKSRRSKGESVFILVMGVILAACGCLGIWKRLEEPLEALAWEVRSGEATVLEAVAAFCRDLDD